MNDQSMNESARAEAETGNQVEVAPPQALAPMRDKLMAGASVTAIVPRSFEEVWRIAQLAVKSGLAPRDIKTPERAAIAIMHGLEIGLPPMAALQRIAVINGRPCVWGDAVPGIALSTHQLAEWSEEITGSGDEMTATCRVVRKMGIGFMMTKVAAFSVADAKKANLWDERPVVKRWKKDGGGQYDAENDSPWYCYPKRMLQMRARVAFRDLFADAMCGLYIAEELVGRDTDAQMRDVTPAYQRIENPLGGGDEVPPKTVDRDMAENADDKVQDASEAETNGGKPPGEKPLHEPPAEAGGASGTKRSAKAKPPKSGAQPQEVTVDEFPQPWVQRTPDEYMAYAKEWIIQAGNAAIAANNANLTWEQQELTRDSHKKATRARWDKERAIRNGFRSAMEPAQVKELQDLLEKVGQP